MSLSVCVLASGSTGNATLVSDGQTHLLVDCGLVAREIETRMLRAGFDPRGLAGVLITHAHTDHFRSAGTLAYRYGAPIYVDPAADRAIRERPSNGSYHRVRKSLPIPESIGGIRVETFATSHHVWGGTPVGFVLSAGGARVGVMTDTGTVSSEALKLLAGCQALVLEANYDKDTVSAKLGDRRYAMDWRYLEWVASDHGHLSNDQCAQFLARIAGTETMHVFLAHISENHADQRKDNNSFEKAEQTVREFFSREGLSLPPLHRTYRRGATEGQASILVRID